MEKLTILYDGDCLLCQQFQKYIHLRKHREVEILNAREYPIVVEKLANQGYLINAGLILIDHKKIYLGADALRQLDMIIAEQTWLDRVVLNVSHCFVCVALIYPFCKALRILLFIFQGKRGERNIIPNKS